MTKRQEFTHKSLNILFTCIGRRVSLLNSFRKAARQLKMSARFFGSDTEELSPALQLCDKKLLAKPIGDPDYIPELLEIVDKGKIGLIIPIIDSDLMLLSENKDKFSRIGCHVLISSPEVVNNCQDKIKTFRFLTENHFDTPVTFTARTAIAKKNLTYPCFLKSRYSYASKENALVENQYELNFLTKRIQNCIVQEFIEGLEYACDVYVDFGMKVRCVVPRKRIEVRRGEVSFQIVKDTNIMTQIAKLIETLGAGPGVITIKLVLNPRSEIKFIGISPRFRVGASLSIKAGANFPKWILQELNDIKPNIRFDGFEDNLTMLPYHAEVWVEKH